MKKGQQKIIAILLFCLPALPVFAQDFPNRIQQFLADEQNITNDGIKNSSLLKKFYTLLEYKSAWLGKENKSNRDDLSGIIKQAADFGLEETDYQIDHINSQVTGAIPLHNITDSLHDELRCTDAALHFFKDMIYGNTEPVLGYNGLNYSPACDDIPALLASYVSTHTMPLFINRFNNGLPEIMAIEKKLVWMQTVISDSNFNEVVILSAAVNAKNKPLLTKLYQLGIMDSVKTNATDSLVKQKVKEAQRQFNLLDDGTFRSTIMEELNVPLSVRLRQLILSVNYYRWLHCLTRNQSVIVVNIPAAYLKVYHDNEVILEMRMIVGKRSTPTPTLASRVSEVILYPYWHVPYSIATKELLPSIKKDPGFIEAGNFQVLNTLGKVMDPNSINWQELSVKYFPYTIRQSTGCDNSLGLLKLDFYSPYGVYLHDTPTKSLFMLSKRYFSHGCMRMEKPFELGHLVLKNNQIAIDTLTEKGCLRNQSPITVSADEHMPVIVWYNPVGIDYSRMIIFYEDIYRKFEWIKRKNR
jgi:murein L,D-transpeptidase YcbB/YkuD